MLRVLSRGGVAVVVIMVSMVMVGKFTTQNGTTVTLTVTPAEGYYISNTYSTDVDFDFAEVTGLEA